MCVLSAVRCAYYLPHFDAPFISMYAHFVGMYAHLNKSDTHLSGTCAHLSVHAHICWTCAHHLYRQHLHLLRLQTHTSLPGSYVGMHNTLTTSVGVQNAYRSMTTVALPTLTTLVLPSQPTSIWVQSCRAEWFSLLLWSPSFSHFINLLHASGFHPREALFAETDYVPARVCDVHRSLISGLHV
jgi:hypothetical protein